MLTQKPLPDSVPQRLSCQIILGLMVPLLLYLSAVSIGGISSRALWFDEIWSMRYAGGGQYGPLSLVGTVERLLSQMGHERNPPGYYLSLNLWGNLIGWSEFSVRVLSILVGLLAVAWTFRVGLDLTRGASRRTRLILAFSAAAALSGGAFYVVYMREVRAYIFIVVLTAMTLSFYWRLLHSQRPPLTLQIGFVLGCAALLYTHFAAFLFLGALGLYHLLFARQAVSWRRVTFLAVLAGVLFLPWLPLLFRSTETAVSPYRLPALEANTAGVVYAFSNESAALFVALVVLAAAARGRHAGIIWFLTAAFMALTLALNIVIPVFQHPRYVIGVWPLLALLIGLAMLVLDGRGIHPAPLIAIWLIAGTLIGIDFAATRIPHDTRMPWQRMISVFASHIQPNDLVIFHSPEEVWLQGPEFDHYMQPFPNRRSLLEGIPGLLENDAYLTNVRAFIGDSRRVWLAVDQTRAPNYRLAEFRRALVANYVYCSTAFVDREMSLELYSRKALAPVIRFGEGIGVDLLEPLVVSQQKQLLVLLNLQLAPTMPPNTYSIGLHVEDEAGKLVAQADFGIPYLAFSCQPTLIDVGKLPPGRYEVKVLAYKWETGERVMGTFGGEPAVERVSLGKFTVGK